MSHYTKQDILRMAQEEDVEFIRLQFTDLFGTLKNIAITKNQLERALDNQYAFDGSAIEGFARVEESDMYLYPDPDTFAIFPWRPQQGKVARVICDIYDANEQPYKGDPRAVLKGVIRSGRSASFSCWIPTMREIQRWRRGSTPDILTWGRTIRGRTQGAILF